MDDRSDADLVGSARSGDKRAFGELIDRYQRMAERVALGVVANADIARELAQEAMLQAYLSLDRLRDGERFQSWLYGIVLNVCRSYLRDQKTDLLSLEALMGGLRFEAVPFTGIEPDPQEEAEAQELHQIVLQSVNSLSPKNRAATLLFYYEQLSVREIAATLGVSVAAVKGRLHKSRGRLRELLVPVYTEISGAIPEKEGVRKMVNVVIADVIPRERRDEEGWWGPLCGVVLLDETGRRVLPIWMGQPEGVAIAIGLREFEMPRPMTHSFMAKLLAAAGAELEEVRVEELRDDTFYGVAKLRIGEKVREVDCRPSDAITLAVQTGSPLFVAEEVMDKAGKALPEDVGSTQLQAKGLDSMMDGIQEMMKKTAEETPEKKETRRQEREEATQKMWTFLLGSDAEDAESQ